MRVYLGLGSNLGDRGEYLRQARVLLCDSGKIELIQVSGIYETEPWGVTEQPEFWNQVIEIETQLPGLDLLALCQQVENKLGRERQQRWGPRTMDVDILCSEQMSCQSPELTVPHPQIENREFVLAPLREIAPELILPSGKPVREIRGSGKAVRVADTLRRKILDLLAAQPGAYVSGEAVSKKLGMTRAAVWKQIQQLRAAGFVIASKTKQGYRLDSVPLDLDEWVFAGELKTRELGRAFYIFEQLDSTTLWAKESIRQGVRHGLTVMARQQTAGRGRLQRFWHSPRGGLWLTVVICPQLTLADAAKLTLCAGVAAVIAVERHCGLRLGIKWPNDLMWEGKKVAGILAEVAGEWTSLHTLIMSIGINANIPADVFRGELADAVSLQMILGQPQNLNALAAAFLECLENELALLEQAGFEPIRQKWLERSVGLGREVSVWRGNQEFRGRMTGLAADGSLLLQVGQEEVAFVAGEVKMRMETDKKP